MRTIGLDDFEGAVIKSHRPVVVLFGASYCPACRLMEGSLAEFGELHPEIGTVWVDVADRDALALRERYLWPLGASFSVSLIPVTILFEEGAPRHTLYGAVSVAHLEACLLPNVARAERSTALAATALTAREKAALAQLRTNVLPGRRLRPGALDGL